MFPFAKGPKDEVGVDCAPKIPEDCFGHAFDDCALKVLETAAMLAGFDEVQNGSELELGLLNVLDVASADEGAPKGDEDGLPNGFGAASVFDSAPKGFAGVFAADSTPKAVAADLPNGFAAASGFEGAPKGFAFEVRAFELDGVPGLDPKGLNVVGADEPKEDAVAAGACAEGFAFVGEDGLLKGPDFCSVAACENLIGLLLYEPFPLPRPLLIVPFWFLLSALFAAFSARSLSKAFGVLSACGVPVFEAFE